MDDARRREEVVEEVAEAEAAISEIGRFNAAELAAMNDQLAKLRSEAAQLGMPTARIEQLKLTVTGALGGAAPAPRTSQCANRKVQPAKRTPPPAKTTADRTKAVEDLFK